MREDEISCGREAETSGDETHGEISNGKDFETSHVGGAG